MHLFSVLCRDSSLPRQREQEVHNSGSFNVVFSWPCLGFKSTDSDEVPLNDEGHNSLESSPDRFFGRKGEGQERAGREQTMDWPSSMERVDGVTNFESLRT